MARDIRQIRELLGEQAALLEHQCRTISRDQLHLPGPRYVDDVFSQTDRSLRVMSALQQTFNTGRLAGTGYISILPVDQGIEHSAGASFAPHPTMFDPDSIVKLAVEGGCSAVASTFGVLGAVARKWAHRIPFIVKINHNELLSYPNTGLYTVLWCYVRNSAFKTDKVDHNVSADLEGQANHLGVTIQADIIKQKLPESNGGYNEPSLKGFGKTHKKVYSELSSDHVIDQTRYQVANCYMGRIGLINSGGASTGESDLRDAVATAVINKRAGGMGLIAGRKAFQRPFKEGVELLQAIQDVYLNKDVTVA
jgi:class I fructose-bisphosphate aldolase